MSRGYDVEDYGLQSIHAEMQKFDFFIALDGPGLNGMIGPGGIAKVCFAISSDGMLYYLGRTVKFYPGLSGGHAVQIRPDGKIGFIGNFSQNLCFFDAQSDDLKEVARLPTLQFMPKDYVFDVHYRSQTHVVWLNNRYFLAAFGPYLWKFDFENLSSKPEPVCNHGVLIPHGMKLSSTGEYICICSKDSDVHGWSKRFSIVRIRDLAVRTINTQETVWHLEADPDTNYDKFILNTQVVDPQKGIGDDPYNFTEYSFGFRTNYVYEVDARKAFENSNPQEAIVGQVSFGADEPHHLTSDLVVTRQYVYCNYPASSTIVRMNRELLRHPPMLQAELKHAMIGYVDERVSIPECATTRWRESARNLLEAFTRAHDELLPKFLKALRISRGSMLDGGYGLQLCPGGKYFISAHRGRNEVYAYDAETLRRVKIADATKYNKLTDKITFPSYSACVPKRLPWTNLFWDRRLGFHHSALSTKSCT